MWSIPGNTNQSGFTALLSGRRTVGGNFQRIRGGAFYIPTTTNNEQKVYSKSIFDNSDFIFTDPLEQNYGISCRCIKV